MSCGGMYDACTAIISDYILNTHVIMLPHKSLFFKISLL